jgi:hypothetical protein
VPTVPPGNDIVLIVGFSPVELSTNTGGSQWLLFQCHGPVVGLESLNSQPLLVYVDLFLSSVSVFIPPWIPDGLLVKLTGLPLSVTVMFE